MKTRWSALFALFAAALVLAAGCSDGSSDDWDGDATATLLASGVSDSSEASSSEASSEAVSTGGSSETSDSSGSGSSDDSGSEASGSGDSASDAVSTGESASPGEITESDVEKLLESIGDVLGHYFENIYYWDFASGTLGTDGEGGYTFTVEWGISSANPARKTTLPGLQEKGVVSTSLLAVDLSDAQWDKMPIRTSNPTTGTVIVAIELADSAAGTIPSGLQSVTIVMQASEWTYN